MSGGDDMSGPREPSALDEEEEAPPDEEELDEEPEPDVAPEAEPDPRARRRRRLERLLPDVLKRAIERGIETGLGTLVNTSDHLRGVAQKTNEAAHGLPKELSSVPKEVAGLVFSQIEDTKNAMVRVVAREVREFLEAADLAKELHRALTSLSFEIKTEIRFIPNDAGGVKADVRSAATPKRVRRGSRRPSAAEAEERAVRERRGGSDEDDGELDGE